MASMSRKIDVENFSSTNFEMWKMKTEDLSIDRDLWDAIDENKLRPTDLTLSAQYDVTNRKAKGLIRLCLTDSILINVHEELTVKKLWKKLSEIYQEKSLANKIFLRKKLYFLRMEEGEKIYEHLERFNMLVTHLTLVWVPMDEEKWCQILLCSLPDSWDSLVMAIGGTFVLKMEDVVGSLLSEEMRRKVSLNAKDSLSVHGRPRERGKNEKQHGHSKSKNKGRSNSPDKSKEIFWNCGKPGHFQKDCKEEKKKKKKKKQDCNFESEKEDGDAFIAALATHAGENAWLIA